MSTPLDEQSRAARSEGYATFEEDYAAFVRHAFAFFDRKQNVSGMTLEQFNDCERGRAARRYVEWAASHGGVVFGPAS